MSSSEENVVFNLDIDTSRSHSSVRKLETILYRTLSLYSRISRLLGIPEDSPINQAVAKTQQLVMVVRQLHTAVLLLQAASGPIGWAMAGIGVAGVAVSSVEFIQSAGE